MNFRFIVFLLAPLLFTNCNNENIAITKKAKLKRIWELTSYTGYLPLFKKDTSYVVTHQCSNNSSINNTVSIKRTYFILFKKGIYSLLEARKTYAGSFNSSQCTFDPYELPTDYYKTSEGYWSFHDSKSEILLEEQTSWGYNGGEYLLKINSLTKKKLDVENVESDSYQFSMIFDFVPKSDDRNNVEQYF